jgi:bleomycin hydrolase
MNDILVNYLKTAAKKIRSSPPAKHTQLIGDHMKKVHSLLTKCVGVPPKKVPSLKNNNKCTPLELYQKDIRPLPSNDVMKKVVMIHVPNLKENQYYVIDELNNKTNGHVLYYYNVSLKVFKSSVLHQIKACSPVWFGCDFGKFNHKGESLLNNQAFSFDTFPFKKKDLYLPKSNAISMYQTNINHAMLLTGYYYKNSHQKPYYWTIENSHGDKMKNVSYDSNHGFITMSDSWFDQYVVMAVVDETHFQGVVNAKDKNNAIVFPNCSNLGDILFQRSVV